MFKTAVKRALSPLRGVVRRVLGMPSIEEQQIVSLRGCVYRAALFTARNYVAGDYLEFGVWRGDSFIRAYHAINAHRPRETDTPPRHPTHKLKFGRSTPEFELWCKTKPRFFAFDSFAGLPKSEETLIEEHWVEGAYECSEEQFLANLADDGVNLSNVVTVPGFYDKTLSAETKQRLGLCRAAIVHIDCDLHESTTLALDFVTDLLSQGTILVFDDWFHHQGRTDMGEQRACREWLARNRDVELIEYWRDIHAIAFIVNFPHGRSAGVDGIESPAVEAAAAAATASRPS
jgi:O-methyltransferase